MYDRWDNQKTTTDGAESYDRHRPSSSCTNIFVFRVLFVRVFCYRSVFILWFSTVVYVKRIFVSKIEIQECPKYHRDKCKKINWIIFDGFTGPRVPPTILNPAGPWFGRQTFNGLQITFGETLPDRRENGGGGGKAISVSGLLQRGWKRNFFLFLLSGENTYLQCVFKVLQSLSIGPKRGKRDGIRNAKLLIGDAWWRGTISLAIKSTMESTSWPEIFVWKSK